MRLLVGLGNPGPRYAGNRHNIGFMVVQRIAARWGFPSWRARFSAYTTEGEIAGERVLLMAPQTYMNESGRAVGEAARFLKIPPADVIVFHDELDLAPFKVRTKLGGGNAGHNGLRSITAHIGNDYRRVRLGIGHPGDKRFVQPHVLSDFANSERDLLDTLVDAAADNADLLVRGDEAGFLNKTHLALQAAGLKDAAGS